MVITLKSIQKTHIFMVITTQKIEIYTSPIFSLTRISKSSWTDYTVSDKSGKSIFNQLNFAINQKQLLTKNNYL